jgi:hypothetical protein
MSKVSIYHKNISFLSIFNELVNELLDVIVNVHLNHYIQISILNFGFIQCAFQIFAFNWPFDLVNFFLTFDAKSKYLYK